MVAETASTYSVQSARVPLNTYRNLDTQSNSDISPREPLVFPRAFARFERDVHAAMEKSTSSIRDLPLPAQRLLLAQETIAENLKYTPPDGYIIMKFNQHGEPLPTTTFPYTSAARAWEVADTHKKQPGVKEDIKVVNYAGDFITRSGGPAVIYEGTR